MLLRNVRISFFALALGLAPSAIAGGYESAAGAQVPHGHHAEAKKDIVDTAIEAGSFDTLVTAVTAAGLVETLKGDGPFTVFAPNDAAFAKLPKSDLDALLADKDKLAAVLTYHVVPGKVMAKDVAGLTKAQTVQGQDLTVDTTDGVRVDNAQVVATDIETSNGVIHVIDTVVLPKL